MSELDRIARERLQKQRARESISEAKAAADQRRTNADVSAEVGRKITLLLERLERLGAPDAIVATVLEQYSKRKIFGSEPATRRVEKAAWVLNEEFRPGYDGDPDGYRYLLLLSDRRVVEGSTSRSTAEVLGTCYVDRSTTDEYYLDSRVLAGLNRLLEKYQ
jgi:hypothetical protein